MNDEVKKKVQLWGEYEKAPEEFPASWSRDILNNIENKVILNSTAPIQLKSSFCGEGKSNFSTQPKHDIIKIDDVIKRTCKLLKHKDGLKEAADKGRLEFDVSGPDQTAATTPGNDTKNERSVQFYKHENSNFMKGIFDEPPANITYESTLKVLRSCVSSILAFHGFSSATMVPLQLLTELAEDYIKRMTRLFQLNVEKGILRGETGFTDAIDRTCYEMGIGSVRNLAQHYKEETLPLSCRRMKALNEEIKIHEETIRKLRDEKRQTSELSFVEMDDEDVVIPELHLTSISGSEMSSKPFEAGLQMLQTLERQQLMSMDMSNQPGCSSSTITVDLTAVKSEFEDVKPFKRRRK